MLQLLRLDFLATLMLETDNLIERVVLDVPCEIFVAAFRTIAVTAAELDRHLVCDSAAANLNFICVAYRAEVCFHLAVFILDSCDLAKVQLKLRR